MGRSCSRCEEPLRLDDEWDFGDELLCGECAWDVDPAFCMELVAPETDEEVFYGAN